MPDAEGVSSPPSRATIQGLSIQCNISHRGIASAACSAPASPLSGDLKIFTCLEATGPLGSQSQRGERGHRRMKKSCTILLAQVLSVGHLRVWSLIGLLVRPWPRHRLWSQGHRCTCSSRCAFCFAHLNVKTYMCRISRMISAQTAFISPPMCGSSERQVLNLAQGQGLPDLKARLSRFLSIQAA